MNRGLGARKRGREKVAGANDRQVGGDHYRKRAIQPWDYAAANNLDFFQGTIVKHVTRWRDKLGVEDLEKAGHYLEKYLEVARAEVATAPQPEGGPSVLELLAKLERCHLNLDTYENVGKALRALADRLKTAHEEKGPSGG